MLQVDEPGTYVLATNRMETVRTFAAMSFRAAGMELEWLGQEKDECGVDMRTGRVCVRVSSKHNRPAEVDLLIGDAGLARERLGWSATTTLEELCELMVQADLRRAKNGAPW
jgi:GDPmannose 4,6-dehydratase